MNTSVLEVSCFDTEHAEFAVCLSHWSRGVRIADRTRHLTMRWGQISAGSHQCKEHGPLKAVTLVPDV